MTQSAENDAVIRFPTGARISVGGAHRHPGDCGDECDIPPVVGEGRS